MFALFIIKERNSLILINGNLEIYKFNVHVPMNVFVLNSCLVGLEEKRSTMQSLLSCWRVWPWRESRTSGISGASWENTATIPWRSWSSGSRSRPQKVGHGHANEKKGHDHADENFLLIKKRLHKMCKCPNS